MPHIFFERLERRISTQSILGNLPTNGISGFSSYAPSAPSGNSGPYGLPLGIQGQQGPFGSPPIMCYLFGPLAPHGENGIGIGYGINSEAVKPSKPVSSKLPSWVIPWSFSTQPSWQQPWLNPSYTSPSWNFLNNWLSPIQNYQQTPFNYSPSWNYFNDWYSPITNYPQTPSIPTYPWNTYMDKLSKLNNVRKDLLAFFQKKGILSDKQRQRLLSTPFEKA